MKRILLIIIVTMVSSVMMTVKAQLPSEEITILKNQNNDQSLTISCPEIPNACYEWYDQNGSLGSYTASVLVYPQLGENVYRAVRTSKFGREEKYVTVNVVGCISLDVDPLVGCYPSGATVSKNDFKINTSPPGYEDFVIVSPDHVSNNGGAPEEMVDITFSIMHDRACASKTVQVNVINDNLGGSHQGSFEFDNWIRTFNAVQNKLNDVQRKLDRLYKYNGYIPVVDLCVPVLSFAFNTPSYQAITSCCEGKIGYGYKTFFPGLSASVGVDCNIPLSWVVGVALPGWLNPVRVVIGANVFINISEAHIKYVNTGCTDVVIPIRVGASLSGGARLDLIDVPGHHFKVLYGSVRLVGTAATEWLWNISKPIQWKGVTLPAAVVIDASFMNIFKYKYSYTFATLKIL